MHLCDTDYSLSLKWLGKRQFQWKQSIWIFIMDYTFIETNAKKILWIILPEVHRIFIRDYTFIKTNAKKNIVNFSSGSS